MTFIQVNLTSKETGRSSLGALKLTVAQAEATRDAAIKAIYVRLFDWVVGRVNASICGSLDDDGKAGETGGFYTGLLDIFGFEVFTFNSFEQLCINYANEKLHQYFLKQVGRRRRATTN